MTGGEKAEAVERLVQTWLRDVDDKAVEVLELAAGWVERGWTQGCYAVDEAGEEVDSWGASAERWSSVGAIRAAMHGLGLVTVYPDPERPGRGKPELLRGAYEIYQTALWAAVMVMDENPGSFPSENEEALTAWNDGEAESGEQVAEKLRAAAQLLRQRLGQGGKNNE